MTTVVKGAGRKKHAANRKHQQDGPLPPKGGPVDTQAPAAYTAQLVEAASKTKKEKKAKDKAAKPATDNVGATGSSVRKAEEFVADAKKWGWEPDGIEAVATLASVTVRRGDETIFIQWKDGRFQENCTHGIGGRSVKLRNASAARGAMTTPAEKVRRDVRRRVPGQKVADSMPKAALPFDLDKATDEEVLKAVEGRQLTWRNSMSGDLERVRVPRTEYDTVSITKEGKVVGTKQVKANNLQTKLSTTKAGRRVLTWAAPGEGFRSVALDSLLQIR